MDTQKLMVDPEKLYTQAEYARVLKVSQTAIKKMIETKRVKSITVKGGILVYVD